MSLQFVIGGSGSGKTTEILNKITKESMEMPSKHFLVIVPEQFTMQTQKEIVRLHPFHSVMNIEILSFMRLSYRIFSELGGDDFTVLGDTGKNLILRKVFEDKKDELSVLKIALKKSGYVSEIRSLLSEFSQYRLSADDMNELRDIPGFTQRFKSKMDDIETVYRGFESFIEGNYITTEDVLEKLEAVAKDSKILSDCVIVLDGFTGFTPVQMSLLSTLIPLASEVYVTVTLDNRDNFTGEIDEHELFFMGKKMIQSLSKICREEDVEILSPMIMPDSKERRFKDSEILFNLEQNIFRDEVIPYDKEVGDSIKLIRVNDTSDEMDYISSQIVKGVREEGMRYSDFAVVTSSMDVYAYKAETSFKKYSIPFFMDQNRAIRNNPIFEFAKRALILVDKGFRNEDILSFLKCKLPLIDEEELDFFERYITAMNIRGWKNIKNPFIKSMRYFEKKEDEKEEEKRKEKVEIELLDINNTREIFVGLISDFYEAIKNAKVVRDYATALFHLVDNNEIETYLSKHAIDLREKGDEVLAREYEEVYDFYLDLLDRMVELLGDTEVKTEEFIRLFDAGLDTLKVGMIPPSNDCVMFGDIERTRLSDVKVLFLCGAIDGMLPKSESRGGILSELEREKLREEGIELSPTGRERSFRQKYYLYMILSKPSERLYITSPKLDGEGKSGRQSFLYNDILKIFPKLKIEENLATEDTDRIVNERTAVDTLIMLLSKYRNDLLVDSEKENLSVLIRYFIQKNPEKLNSVLKDYFFKHKPNRIMSENLAKYILEELHGSVTTMQKYAECPYRFFMEKIMRAYEWNDFELNSMAMGNFYHDVLKNTLEKVRFRINEESEKGSRPDLKSEEFIRELVEFIDSSIEKSREKYSYYFQEKEDLFKLEQIKDTLRVVIPLIVGKIGDRVYPAMFEADFGKLQKGGITLDSLQYELEKGSLIFNGKVDRVDIEEIQTEDSVSNFVDIIDYKSGSKDVDLSKAKAGLDMQMFVYLDGILEYLNKSRGDESYLPGGMSYINVTDDIGSKTKKSDPEEALLDTMFTKGYFNERLNRSKDGFNESLWKEVSDSIRETIVSLGDRMTEGDIDCKPYRNKDGDGCKYCNYHNVCHFDRKLQGFEYRNID